MILAQTIQDLKIFLEKKLYCQVTIGEVDLQADNYPSVLLIPDGGGEVNERFGKNAKNLEFTLTIRIICQRNDPLVAIDILDSLAINERLFKPEMKNELTAISTGYTENTYVIDCVYILNNFIRKSV